MAWQADAALAGGGLSVDSAELRMGPFDVVGGPYASKLFYAEPVFGDDKKDPRPWDLRGWGAGVRRAAPPADVP